uniref:TMF_TATA_bd domain-containing protein n=1 Tax=Anopheles christyi TaxID=43041 RepID=A0A182KBZ4_9DIPT
MSWFDTTGIANLAKNALKEAQKQIDKALDIKYEEETTNTKFKSACVETASDEIFKKSTLFDQPAHKSRTVVKPPSNLRPKSGDISDSRHSFGSLATELDSFESTEVHSPVTIAGSGSTCPSRRPSWAIALHDDKTSDSVELFGAISTLPNSTPKPSTIVQSICLDNYQSQQHIVLKEHSDNDEDDISDEDDTFSNTLSEQPIAVLETCVSLPPITVAPCRSCHLFSNTHVVGESCPTPLKYNKKKEDYVSLLERSSKNMCNIAKADDSVKHVPKDYHMNSLATRLFTKPRQELENSYDNLEIHTHITDFAHSFEEITSSNIVFGDHFQTIASSGKLEDSENKVDAAFESLVGLGTGQSMFQSIGEDEIETTASSDIEIISSPNGGDSSSTNSGVYRTSPLKISGDKGENFDMLLIKKRRGHTREISEISVNSGNSDDSSHLPETELLMRRLVEISETLEQREYRLVELGRQNAELHEQNTQLTAQLESKAKREGGFDFDGYMHRLSSLERKFQQSIREKENLKSKLEALHIEADKQVAKCDMDKALIERDFIINELQKEGETLSKQVLHHSNIIKKLRTKEKECDVLIRKQCDEITDLTLETERLKRTLSAKDEVERSQIDAVHKLTSEKCKLERERSILNGNLEDQLQNNETLRKSLEIARNEHNEQLEICQDLKKRLAKQQNCETDLLSFKKTNEVLITQMDDLRKQLRRTEQDYGQRLNRAKNEHAEILRKLEASELRSEEEKNTSALLTKPLMKQLDSLQNLLRHKERMCEQRDAAFAQQLLEALERIKLIAEKEKTQRGIIIIMQNRITNLEERLTAARLQTEEIVNKLEQQTDSRERDCINQLETIQLPRITFPDGLQKKAFGNECAHESETGLVYSDEVKFLNQNMLVEGNEYNKKNDSPMTNELDLHKKGAFPAASVGSLYLPDSLNSIPWINLEDDVVPEGKGASNDGIIAVGYNLPISFNTTSHLETLQATLKQRDGEVYQLQWEVSRFQQERNVLSTELSNLTIELDNVRERFENSIRIEEEHTELQNRYDALLQMYGESVEKNEELQLDLVDVKEMYKLQIDDLLQRQRDLISSMSHQS